MGGRKLEMKQIEDENSRQLRFSKRRSGLIKKARQLSVICDVDVHVVVVSSAGKLHKYCSGGDRYHKNCSEAQERTTEEGASQDMGTNNTSTRFHTINELVQSVERVDEEGNKVSVSEMTDLEEELNDALMHIRSRKTQLIKEQISTLHEQEKKSMEEMEELKQQLQVCSAAANQKQKDEAGGLDS